MRAAGAARHVRLAAAVGVHDPDIQVCGGAAAIHNFAAVGREHRPALLGIASLGQISDSAGRKILLHNLKVAGRI